MDVCALRFIVLELLRGFVDDVTSFDELSEKLDCISQENILAERWVKNLIQLIFLMTLFITVEREGELPLHLYACKKCSHISLLQGINQEKGMSKTNMRNHEKKTMGRLEIIRLTEPT